MSRKSLRMCCPGFCNVRTEGGLDHEQWETRRPELLELFTSQVYGCTPEEKIDVTYEILTEDLVR